MVHTKKKSKITLKRSGKSKELRKYEIAYNKCIKLGIKSRKCKRSIKRLKPNSRRKIVKSLKRKKKSLKKSKSRSLNAYQKFVKKESKKSIYKGKSAKSRMRAISKLWRKSKYI